jgi:hypothetical protein
MAASPSEATITHVFARRKGLGDELAKEDYLQRRVDLDYASLTRTRLLGEQKVDRDGLANSSGSHISRRMVDKDGQG